MKAPYRAGLGLLIAAVLAVAAAAAPPFAKNSKSEWRRVLAGQGTALVLQQMTATASTKVLDCLDDSAASVASIDREGDLTAVTLNGRHVDAADTTQTLAAAGALTLTAGKSFFRVAGDSGAVTGCTIPNGTIIGARIVVAGTDDTNTVQFATNAATNIATANGTTTRTLGNADLLTLVWNGTKWCEISFNNNL